MSKIQDAERAGFKFGRANFPKVPPADYSPEEASAWMMGWEFSKVKSLHGRSITEIQYLVEHIFYHGSSDALYALDNFVEVALARPDR